MGKRLWAEAFWIETQLAIARQLDRNEIVALANAIGNYVRMQRHRLPTDRPDLWVRIANWVDALGHRLGRRTHRAIISVLLVLWALLTVGSIVAIAGGTNLNIEIAEWRVPLIVIQSVVAGCMIVAAIAWLCGSKECGLAFSIGDFCLSLVVLQLLNFYLSQFAAITATLIQLACLQILIAYRRWHLQAPLTDEEANLWGEQTAPENHRE